MDFKSYIRDIEDFPKNGIIFKDITPLLQKGEVFRGAIRELYNKYKDEDIDYVVGIESRGFLVGTPLAMELGKGFIPIRKPGKLPAEVINASYELEYGSNNLEIHRDAINEGDNILIIDDLLATGGTVNAAIELIEKLDGNVIGIGFLLELEFLEGKKKLKGYDVFSLIKD